MNIGAGFAEDGPPDAWITTYMHMKQYVGAETPVAIIGKHRSSNSEYDVFVSVGAPGRTSWYQNHCVQLLDERWLCTTIETPFYQFVTPNTVPTLPGAAVSKNSDEGACMVDGNNLFDGKGKFLGTWSSGTDLPPSCKSVNAR